VYAPTGHLLFAEAGSGAGLWSVPFSLERLEVTGEPSRITDRGSDPGVSVDRSLLYSNVSSVGDHQMVRVDRAGEVVERIGDPVTHADNLALSPDGTKLAVCLIDPQGASIWIYDLERAGARSRVSSTNSSCGGSRGHFAWTRDGRHLVAGDARRGIIGLIGVDGASPEHDLTEGERPTLTADGRSMIFVRTDQDGHEDLWRRPIGPDPLAPADPEPWLVAPGRQSSPCASPVDPLVAYVDDTSGRNEVYLRTFPDGGNAWQVSAGGGQYPTWSSDGRHLYFLRDEVVAMEVDVELVGTAAPNGSGLSVRLSDPRELFAGDVHRLGPNHGWDVVGTGKTFVTVELSELDVGDRDLTLVTGWNP
jgi:Tol biopolymer transport system component